MVQPTKADTLPVPPQPTSPAEALHVAFRRAVLMMRKVQSGDPALIGVLHHLSSAGPIRLTVLAEQLILDTSTVSRHVRTLESGGLLTRQTDPDDGRASLLVLTGEGHAVLERTRAKKVRMFRAATAGWSDADIYAFVDAMNRLADDIGRVNDLEST